MIGSLRGTLLERCGTSVTVEVGGVGYRLSVTASTSDKPILPTSI